MCNRRSLFNGMSELEYYYSAEYSSIVDGMAENDGEWLPQYHINGFDFPASPIISSKEPQLIRRFHWGLIPHKVKDHSQAMEIRSGNLMCRSEEMYDKWSYADLAKFGKRCLIPTSGFFEHQWADGKGKRKIPYYIFMKDRPLFSIGGLYSRWIDPATGKAHYTYTLCTTSANTLMEEIHNSGKRMPVMLQDKKAEAAWIDPQLSKSDVLDLCKPIDANLMDAYTISRLLTSRTENSNVPEVLQRVSYPKESSLFD